MSITKPDINSLLDQTEHNPFLLCTIASRRACDINNMLRGQHARVVAVQEVDDITTVVSGQDPISIALTEINEGTLSYNHEELREELHGDPTDPTENN